MRDGLGLGPEVVLAAALVQTQRRVQGLEGELLQQVISIKHSKRQTGIIANNSPGTASVEQHWGALGPGPTWRPFLQ